MQNSPPLNILMIEDNPADVLYLEEILAELEERPFFIEQAGSLEQGLAKIARKKPAAVLLDLGLPDSIGLPTLHSLFKAEPSLPVLVLTGLDDTDVGVNAVSEGAQDYLVKGRFDAPLLIKAIRYAIERNKLRIKLQEALAEVKRLSGFIPICSNCKKIRNDTGYWQEVEAYIEKHSEAQFSHSICQECSEKLYPEVFDDKDNNG